MSDVAVNAVYYLYQDKYSFWYALQTNRDITINYAVLPSRREDRYESIVYRYDGEDFCKALVEQNVRALGVERTPIADMGENEFLYLNTLELKAGYTYYLSVLSLNDDDCGHKFYVQTREEDLSINAIHRPCYQVQVIDEMIDFSAALAYEPDVDLDLKNVPSMESLGDGFKKGDSGSESLKAYPLRTVTLERESPEKLTYGDRILLYGVKFYNRTYAFKPGSKPFLKEVVQFMDANPDVVIEIEGHVNDSIPRIEPDPKYKGLGSEYNFTGTSVELSLKRSQAVMSFLEEQGVDPDRMKALGMGAEVPRQGTSGRSTGDARNDRIEILIKKK